MKKIKFLTLALVILAFACSKDEVEPSKLTLLTGNETKSWRVTQVELNGEIRNDICERDDIFTFELYNEKTETTRFSIADNFVSCTDAEDYIIASGSWRLNNKGNRITFVIRDEFVITNENNQQEEITDFFNLVFDIIEISQSKLVLRQLDEGNEFAADVYTYTLIEI